MKNNQLIALTRGIKGAAASIIIVMHLLNRRTGHDELITLTGYSDKSVANGLRVLEIYGLAFSDSRFNGWQLTDKGRQLPLLGQSLLSDPAEGNRRIESENFRLESENFRLGSSSSSSLLIESHDHEESLKQLLLPQIESEILRLDLSQPEFDRLTNILVIRCGCPRKKAPAAIEKALAAGMSPLLIEYRVLAWLAYCLSKNGQNLNPAHFVASRITETCCPDGFDKTSIQDRHFDLYTELGELEHKLDSQED